MNLGEGRESGNECVCLCVSVCVCVCLCVFVCARDGIGRVERKGMCYRDLADTIRKSFHPEINHSHFSFTQNLLTLGVIQIHARATPLEITMCTGGIGKQSLQIHDMNISVCSSNCHVSLLNPIPLLTRLLISATTV